MVRGVFFLKQFILGGALVKLFISDTIFTPHTGKICVTASEGRGCVMNTSINTKEKRSIKKSREEKKKKKSMKNIFFVIGGPQLKTTSNTQMTKYPSDGLAV